MKKSLVALTGSLVISLILAVAPAQAAGPDYSLNASIRLNPDGGWVGSRIVNETAEGQTVVAELSPGDVLRFGFKVNNSAGVPDTAIASGCGASRGLRVTYLAGGVNVTEQVQLGMFDSGQLAPDTAMEGLVLKVRARPSATRRNSLACKLTMASINDLEVRDTVQAQVNVV